LEEHGYRGLADRRKGKASFRRVPLKTCEEVLRLYQEKYFDLSMLSREVWERNWQRVIPFFEFPEEIRKIIYTTNTVESLHMTLRKVTKNRGSFPTQNAAVKLLYLALQKVASEWYTIQGWREALRQFAIRWPERIEQARAA
jgi:putative transposase